MSENCPLCGVASTAVELAEAGWLAADAVERIRTEHPSWSRADGGCPACVQQALLELLTERGEAALQAGIQSTWPLDAEAAFGALPTPLRLHADPRFSGRGVTLALCDSGFYPHPDLVQPTNRIRAWVDAGRDPVRVMRFQRDETPRWPGWDGGEGPQWHGLMTSTAATGNGWLSHGLYRGLASDADLVLVQVRDQIGHITNETIRRALEWLLRNGAEFNVRVVSLSVAGEPVEPLAGNPVDEAVAALVAGGIAVVAAAGNDGRRELVPPATAPLAVTVGGLDDHSTFDHSERELWHSNYGDAENGAMKPELVAPSIWVVAPLLPGTPEAAEARDLFVQRAAGNLEVEPAIAERKLLTPHYQHVDGTSFAAPVVAGVATCMIEANPSLGPLRLRELLTAAAHPIHGAPLERQGAGAIDAGRAVALAMGAGHHTADIRSPRFDGEAVVFRLHDALASSVEVYGSWDGWRGSPAGRSEPGVWQARLPGLRPGRHAYKFRLDHDRWLTDPLNSTRAADSFGGFNSVLHIPG